VLPRNWWVVSVLAGPSINFFWNWLKPCKFVLNQQDIWVLSSLPSQWAWRVDKVNNLMGDIIMSVCQCKYYCLPQCVCNPPKWTFLLTRFNLKLSVELGGDVGYLSILYYNLLRLVLGAWVGAVTAAAVKWHQVGKGPGAPLWGQWSSLSFAWAASWKSQ